MNNWQTTKWFLMLQFKLISLNGIWNYSFLLMKLKCILQLPRMLRKAVTSELIMTEQPALQQRVWPYVWWSYNCCHIARSSEFRSTAFILCGEISTNDVSTSIKWKEVSHWWSYMNYYKDSGYNVLRLQLMNFLRCYFICYIALLT